MRGVFFAVGVPPLAGRRVRWSSSGVWKEVDEDRSAAGVACRP